MTYLDADRPEVYSFYFSLRWCISIEQIYGYGLPCFIIVLHGMLHIGLMACVMGFLDTHMDNDDIRFSTMILVDDLSIDTFHICIPLSGWINLLYEDACTLLSTSLLGIMGLAHLYGDLVMALILHAEMWLL